MKTTKYARNSYITNTDDDHVDISKQEETKHEEIGLINRNNMD